MFEQVMNMFMIFICIYLYDRKHLYNLVYKIFDLFLWSNRWIVKLRMCAQVCHVDERMFILLIDQTEFKIPPLRTRLICRPTWIRVAAISKLVATSTSKN